MISPGCRHLPLHCLCLLLPSHHQGGGQPGEGRPPHHPAEGGGGEEVSVGGQGDHDVSLQRDPAGSDSPRKDPAVRSK